MAKTRESQADNYLEPAPALEASQRVPLVVRHHWSVLHQLQLLVGGLDVDGPVLTTTCRSSSSIWQPPSPRWPSGIGRARDAWFAAQHVLVGAVEGW